MRNRGRSFARSNRPLRPMDWNGGYLVGLLASGERSQAWAISPDAIEREFTDPTLMRTIVHACLTMLANPGSSVAVDNTGGTAGASHIGIGIIKWQGVPVPSRSEDVVSAVGSASLPTMAPCPIRDSQLDWIFRWIVPIPPNSAVQFVPFTNGGCDLDRESSAKRRLGNDSGLLVVVSNLTSTSMSFAWSVRYLLKE